MKLDLELRVETQSFDAVFTRIDGASGQELLTTVRTSEPRLTFALLMPAGDVAWEKRHGPAEVTIHPSEDLSGAGGAEVIYSRTVGGVFDPVSRIEAIDGNTGGVLWGHGGRLPRRRA